MKNIAEQELLGKVGKEAVCSRRCGSRLQCDLNVIVCLSSLRAPEVAWAAEDGEGEPQRQHGADEDVAGLGAAVGV